MSCGLSLLIEVYFCYRVGHRKGLLDVCWSHFDTATMTAAMTMDLPGHRAQHHADNLCEASLRRQWPKPGELSRHQTAASWSLLWGSVCVWKWEHGDREECSWREWKAQCPSSWDKGSTRAEVEGGGQNPGAQHGISSLWGPRLVRHGHWGWDMLEAVP